MYKNFDLEGRNFKIKGYEYLCENPNHVVVLIHGIGEHAGRYERMAEFFNKEGIALISMDLRGHGKSGGVRGHAAPRTEILGDIDALISYAKRLYPDIPLILYGHSMGGNITLDYRARGCKNHIPAAYIISAPWIRLVKPVSKGLFQVVKLMSKLAPSLTTSSECEEKDLGNLDFVRPYKQAPLVHPKISMLCAYEGFTIGQSLEEGTNFENVTAKSAFEKPCLLMQGSEDKICSPVGARNFAKLNKNSENPNFTYVELDGYYHEIHNGAPEITGEKAILEAVGFIKNI